MTAEKWERICENAMLKSHRELRGYVERLSGQGPPLHRRSPECIWDLFAEFGASVIGRTVVEVMAAFPETRPDEPFKAPFDRTE